jgi:hypothetical protein
MDTIWTPSFVWLKKFFIFDIKYKTDLKSLACNNGADSSPALGTPDFLDLWEFSFL